MTRKVAERSISLMLIALFLFSCVQNPVEPNRVSRAAMISESVRQINQNLFGIMDTVREIDKEGEYSEFISSLNLEEMEKYLSYSGEEIVRGLEEETGGDNMISFIYSLDKFDSTDDVIRSTEKLINDEESINTLKEISQEIEEKYTEDAERALSEMSRALTPSQKDAFFKEVKKMVIKSVVLLAAALVYSMLPTSVFWGKVSAAAAFSIAAGVLAATILNLIQYFKSDNAQEKSKTFSQWVEDLAVEPAKYWSVALGFLNTYKAMNISPLLGALLLAVFTLAGIVDDVKPLLRDYNLKA